MATKKKAPLPAIRQAACCGNCKFQRPDSSLADGYGQCRRFPPSWNSEMEVFTPPIVQLKKEWCGEHRFGDGEAGHLNS